MDTGRLQYLLDKYLSEDMSTGERAELFNLFNDPACLEQLTHTIDQQLLRRTFEMTLDNETKAAIKQHFEPVLAKHRVYFLRKWGWAAAAAILVTGATIAVVWSSKWQPSTVAVSAPTDILPGSTKAILTLASGRQIELDSTAATTINDGDLAIQNKNGELVYAKGEAAVVNKVTTPNGGQYQLTLSDGTKVWLNAASSIIYSTAFNGADRRVKITGEAYLEVAKDKARPFIVDIDGRSTIEVLGTSFNINSYADEGSIKTTLVTGSVRVLSGTNEVMLKPGQQAIIANAAGIAVHVNTDLNQILAWKNGLFNFNGLSVREGLNQLARWYDIKIQIQGKEPAFRFMGEMYRSASLAEVLKVLQKMEVNFRMEGRTLIIL